jgi:hypothetical protein
MIQLRCAGCKEAEGITVVSSMFGATSFALCDKCLKEGREDYRNMVNYISAAGHWPQDINEIYQAEVRRQLKLHGKTEEEFRDAVENAIAEEQMFMISIHNRTFEF